jgi:hypothetical protein
MRVALALATCLLVLASPAPGQERKQVPQYPYPAEPMYQYPAMDSRGEKPSKCPKGLKPYQGECRKWRRVD